MHYSVVTDKQQRRPRPVPCGVSGETKNAICHTRLPVRQQKSPVFGHLVPHCPRAVSCTDNPSLRRVHLPDTLPPEGAAGVFVLTLKWCPTERDRPMARWGTARHRDQLQKDETILQADAAPWPRRHRNRQMAGRTWTPDSGHHYCSPRILVHMCERW